MRPRCLAVLLLWSSFAPAAIAAVTTEVIDLPSRGVTQRILYLKPDAPVATIVYAAGGTGALGIQNNGAMTTIQATCGPISRYAQAYADSGVAVALVDATSDGNVWDPRDTLTVLRYVQSRANVPTWMVGISGGVAAVVASALTLPADVTAGYFALNPDPVEKGDANAIKRPTMVVIHRDDANGGAVLYDNLTQAPVRELTILSGGTTGGCGGLGHHVFVGQDAELLVTIRGLMDKHAAALAVPPVAIALAVEFYHAGLDHYFLTHIAGEIALLDAGTTIKGWVRTGEGFTVYPAAQPVSSPVCRFYIPPEKGSSHFYGRGTVECNATGAANPTFVNEDPQFFHVVLPVAGVCPAGTRNVYRTFSNRADANHRYMVKAAIRDEMVAKHWLAEGDGPDLVVMCSPV